ncbi:hypothetical protein ACI760_02990 [Capnocytophaga canimorsus]|uniref:hypothetical protein n=1 Tax=Capnocytophaga canimorsus TaxID=28188 RepID=UPI00385C0061
MRVLSSESFRNIVYLIQQQNYANIHARLILKLPAEESSLFAKINIKNNEADWYIDSQEDYKPYEWATPEEKELIAAYLEKKKAKISEKLSSEMPFVAELFSVPSDEQIFFKSEINDQVKVVLAQWGFQKANTLGNVDVIDFLIAQPRKLTQTEVTLHINYSDGSLATQETFDYTFFNTTKEIRTDEQGNFYVGSLLNGRKFSVSNGNETFDFEVQRGINVYKATFELKTAYLITVVNQEETLQPDCEIRINGIPHSTNEKGEINKSDVLLTQQNQILEVTSETGEVVQFELQRDAKKNVFQYMIRQHFSSWLEVFVGYENREPLVNYPIHITTDQKITYQTDANGRFLIDNLEPDTTIFITDGKKENHREPLFLVRGVNKYELLIKREEVKVNQVCIRVFNEKKELIPFMPVQLKTKKGELSCQTDEKGEIWLPETEFTHKEKVKISFVYDKDKHRLRKEE